MRRGKMDIVRDILETVKVSQKRKSQVTKTGIVYGANLNFNRAEKYLDLLLDVGLVTKTSNRYSITESGKEYLQKMNDIYSCFNDFSDER